ncbi:hypothetical protein E1295_13265 [Nonomuraea mesophila]|uniref:Uncharacterized protein n=1 Tax=Nonomuraea mesophila TaxID=2530382 RepID=A0A4R5FRI6_9ACTN|nr:hypothetical protein [Nonomuraea mesophila]TDE55772.1 hypothetical protein E1295_13265 [Nonomuraea mesophila]
MLTFSAAVFPGLRHTVLSYGLTLPTDPQRVHKAADGWSALGEGVYTAGRTAQQQHDTVPQGNWQAPERELYGERIGTYRVASDTAADSARDVSTILRWVANIQTVGQYLHFAQAAILSAITMRSLLMGPGGHMYGQLQAYSAGRSIEHGTQRLKDLLVTAGAGLGLATAGAIAAEITLTDGLKPSDGAARHAAAT